MKVLLATVIFVCYGIFVSGLRVKRGLSTEEQKKLMDELKKDRAEMAKKTGMKFGELTYDPSLEKTVDALENCAGGTWMTPLKYNSVAQKVIDDKISKETHPTPIFFDPSSYAIGCSKTYKCSVDIPKDDQGYPAEARGKTSIAYGLCMTISPLSSTMKPFFDLKSLPHPSKYGDLIGVVGPSENGQLDNFDGKIFYILIAVFFFVFQF